MGLERIYNKHMKMYDKAQDKTKGTTGAVKIITKNVVTGEETVEHYLNVFCMAGKQNIASRMGAEEGTNKGVVTYFATGTGVGTPDQTDTTMFNELFRKTISVRSVSSNVIYYTTYISTAESNGTLTEVGLFGDTATASADTGAMFAHTNITKTKTVNDTLTIEWAITIN